jgi:hypothetical protein
MALNNLKLSQKTKKQESKKQIPSPYVSSQAS